MKKRMIAGILASVVTAALITGCGGTDAGSENTGTVTEEAPAKTEEVQETEDGTKEEASGEKVTLHYYAWSEGDYLKEMVEAFNASSENVVVEMTQVSSDEYDDKLMTMLAGTNDIDVFNMRSGSLLSNLAQS